MASSPDNPSMPRDEDHRAALEAIRHQLRDKIRERYDVSEEEAERRLRELEQEG